MWTILDFVKIAKQRQKDEFDMIIFWSGPRGLGKSTGSFKFCSRFDCFKPWTHIIYRREDCMKLLEGMTYGVVMDDEAIRSGYKRNFYEEDQKKLIIMLNMYRDNFNIISASIPNFYDLDKDLRNLCTMHIHVVRRGIAVIHLPHKDKLYSNDPWDVAYNSRVESKWYQKIKQDPSFFPPFYKLTTFAGYLRYNALTPEQEKLYKEIKRTKRKAVYDSELDVGTDPKEKVYDNLMKLLKEGFLDNDKLKAICLANDLSIPSVKVMLNRRLGQETHGKTISDYMAKNNNNRKVAKDNKFKDEKLPFQRAALT